MGELGTRGSTAAARAARIAACDQQNAAESSHAMGRRTSLWAALLCAVASPACAAGKAAPAGVELESFEDDESGITVQLPKGWELEMPGGRYEFHAPKDYGGKRVIIKKEFLGKTKALDLRLLGTPEEYAKRLAYAEGEGANTGTKAEVLSCGEAADGRLYFVEFRINSFQPQHVWVVAGAGLGQSPGARKFSNRQLITVTGKISEEELAKDPEGGKLLQQILATFAFTDKPLPEQ
eukprot:jgi/Tetstr1/460625/TSEL_005823.t1